MKTSDERKVELDEPSLGPDRLVDRSLQVFPKGSCLQIEQDLMISVTIRRLQSHQVTQTLQQ